MKKSQSGQTQRSIKLALDVDYREEGGAVAAGVLFADWTDHGPQKVLTARCAEVAPYRPGYLFERELPCLMAVIEQLESLPDAVVIDGYVTLGADRRDGLGAHLHHALGGAVPVIGVAKNRFRDTPPETEVLRGRSGHPLYVTAIGMDEAEARQHIADMHGPYRLPTLLRLADRACREA
ncbi:endonuclease V [Cucumibacter marinus]|uniref:endonuclease V n=1 Tax=Cucumibacter marinus TaxID=1121252 RepID=UPI00041B5C0A|nr:endonuclease V [Cucumibacter marinus]